MFHFFSFVLSFQTQSCGYVYILQTPLICPQLAIEIANNGKNAVVNDLTQAKTYTGKFWGKWKFIHNLFSILNEIVVVAVVFRINVSFNFLFCFVSCSFDLFFYSFPCCRTKKKVSFRNVIVNQCESPKGSLIYNCMKKKCDKKLIKKERKKISRKKSGDMTKTKKNSRQHEFRTRTKNLLDKRNDKMLQIN